MNTFTKKSKLLIALVLGVVFAIASFGVITTNFQPNTSASIVAEEEVDTSVLPMDYIQSMTDKWEIPNSLVGTYAISSDNKIDTQAELMSLANKSGTYTLGADIDLSGKLWSPITGFTGTLDGKGYSIIGLTINDTIAGSQMGLFATASGTIKNLYLKGVNIVHNSATEIGAIVGKRTGTGVSTDKQLDVINCGVKGGQIVGAKVVGGVVGEGVNQGVSNSGWKYCQITRCFAELSLTGGTVGGVSVGSKTDNSYFYGTVSGTSIALINNYGVSNNCYGYSTSGTQPATTANLASSVFASSKNYGLQATNPGDDFWIKDTATSGVMHGAASASKYVLRGVGNIVVTRYVDNVKKKPEVLAPLFPDAGKAESQESNANKTYETIKLVKYTDSSTEEVLGTLAYNTFTNQKAAEVISYGVVAEKANAPKNSCSFDNGVKIHGNWQGDYRFYLTEKGQFKNVKITKVQRSTLNGSFDTNAEYAQISVSNSFTETGYASNKNPTTNNATAKETTTIYVRHGDETTLNFKITSNVNAYPEVFKGAGSGLTFTEYTRDTGGIYNKGTVWSVNTDYILAYGTVTAGLDLKFNFDNQHIVNITGGSWVTGSVSTNVLYNKAFGNVALGEVVRYGYTATAKYGSTTFFTTSSVSAKSLTASTSKWTGVSGSDIPIAWTAANVDIDVEVYVNGVKITDKWDDYLEFKANVSGNIATQTPFTTYWKGTSAYNATTATDISEKIKDFKSGNAISIVVQPKSGYNFSIEYKNCGFKESASGYFQKAETISASGSGTTSSPFVLGNIIEENGGGKIMLKLMERSYDNGIVLYSEIEGKTQDVKYPAPSQNPILFSGNNVRYVAKAEKQTLPMKANGTYKFAVDNLNQIGYGLISIEIRYTDVNGTAQVQTLTNNTTFSLDSKVKQALDANKEVEIVVNFSYNPVQYEIHFYERTSSGDLGDCLNNSSDVVKTTTGGGSTIKVVLNGVTWTQASSNSPLGQIGKIGTTIDTKTADLWKFSFESQGIYKTVDVIMFNQTAAKYGTLTINTLSDSKNYTEFQVSDFGFEKGGIVKIYVLMEMQGFEVKIERELQVVNADQTTFSYESEDLLAVWRIQGATIPNPLIVAHGTNVQTDRANNIITIGSYIVKLNYAPNAVFYNLATEVISVVENGTTTRYSTTNVNATISRAITIKITFELNLFDINVYSYFPDNTSAQKLKTLEDLTLGKQVKLTTTEMAKAGWDVSKIYLYASSSDGNPIVWTTVKNSLVNSNWTSGDLVYNIKLQSNTSKLTSSTLTNFTFGANYFTIFVVYEARDYQIVFSSTTPDKIDMQGNVLGKVAASNVTTVYNLKYGTNLSTVITSLPTASFPNGEYKFEGWSYVRLNGQVFDYANKKFTKENFSTIDHTTKTLTLYMITSPSVVEITYSEANTSGTATYAANNKYTNVPTITKQGHTLAGWQDADGNVYINIEANTVTYAYWNKGQATTLYPIWEAKIITVTYVDKNGTTLGTGTVTYGASNYANVPAAPMVANFSFQHYKYVGAANLLVYSNNNGSTYNINDFNPTFKATYKLSGSGGFDWDLGDGWFAGSGFASAPNGIQNAATTPQYYANYASKDYPLSIKPNTVISGATYTYTWTRTQNGALDSSWTKTGQSISLRDVRDSGIYTVSIKIEFDGESITETYSIDLTVVPRTIQINQQGQNANVVAKYFDNSTLMPSSWNKISTNICDAALTLKLVFAQANVGTALAVSASLDTDESSAYLVSNYVLPSVTGSIIPLPVEFNVSGSQNQIGATNRQVIIPDDCITRKFGTLNQNVYCGISNLDVFLGNNVTATVSTNKNEVGVYKFDGASLILTASVAYGTFSSANLAISKTGSYEIADPGNDYINITINLNYDNTSTTINIEDIASIQVPTTAYQDIYTTKRTISIGGTRNFYQNKAFDISLFINKSNDFWTQKIGIKVDSAEETFSQSTNALLASQKFALDMNQYYQTAKQIIVNIYITNIVNISYNYNLVGGETLVNASDCVNDAKFVYKQTIIASGNALPQPNRIGWQFAGWRYDSVDNNGNITAVAITDNTVWSYKGNETFVLYATYTLKSPEIAVSANINKTYDANVENITFTISNYNGESITYSVKLQKVVNGVSTNDSVFAQSDAVVTKSVVNVIDSANYKLIVTATAGDETLTAESAEIIVTINPYQIYESGITLNKIYDATDALKVYDSALGANKNVVVSGPKSQIISITGKFEGINVGSKLVVSSLAVVENQEIIASNYKIVTTNVEGEIVKKDITIDIGTTNTKFYDGKVFIVTGSVADSQIGATYVYKIQTTDVAAGKYLASEGKLEVVAFGVGTQNANGVTITQDMTNNFTIELKGSAEIKKVETTLVWENTKVVFNGQQQQISFTLANEELRQGLAYEIYYSESFGNLGTKDAPRNAKLYYVTMQILENSNVEIKENLSTTFTISQKTIYISPNAGENFEKVYDGLLTINASYSIFADENKTTPIETAIANYQEITLEFAFSSKNAGTNKAVSVRLLEDNEENKNYVLAAGTAFVGTITKKDITLKISPSTGNVLSKQYDGVAFEVFAKDVAANTLANNEELDGSLIFTNVINAKTYTLTSESFDVANLNASGTNIKTNYNILTTSFKDDQITITKAKLIYTVVKAQYVYDGEPVDIETLFERQDGKADPLPEVTYKFFANNSDVVETQQPTYVGTYYFDFVLSDSNNYEIVNNKRVEFKITKRSVYIEVIESVKYTGEVITYDVTSANVVFRTLADSTQSYGFAPGDVSGLKLTTTNAKVGIYYVKQASEISHTTEIFEETDTQKSNNLYSNYIIYYTEESYIAIEKTEIDFQSIMTIDANTTYNGKVQVLGIQFTEENTNRVVNIKFGETNEDGMITNVFRTQGENTIAITDSKDIYYAGVYTFGLSLTNYEIKNYKQFSKTISAREIVYLQIDGKDITQELLDKQYDGTTTLLGTISAPCDEQKYHNKQIVDSDVSLISVRGNYEQANVKASQKISFSLASTSSELKNSYTLNLASNYQGSITPRKITLKLEEVLTFPYTNEDIVINVINFVAQEGMIAGDYYSGEVTVSGIYDVGTYNLADISTYECDVVLKNYLGETIPATNYEIIGLAGNIQIYATQIWVELGDLSHTYDATAKQAAFTVKTVDAAVSLAKNQEFVTISYKNAKGEAVSPTDAGEYVVVVTLNENQRTNFTLCKEDGNPLLAGVYYYDSTLALVINARKIAVEATNKQISYRGTVVTYTLVDADITDPDAGNGGLLTAVGHKVSAKYTTSGKDVGLYGLPQTAQHKGTVALDGQFVIYDTANNDITSNYNLVSTNVVVEITNAVMSEVDTGDLENLVYNGLSRNAELVIYFQVNETHTSIAYGQTKQVEGMQVVLNGLKYGTKTVNDAIDAGDYTMYLTVGDLAGFVNKPISFTIHQRELVLLFDGQATASKQYDGTSAVNNISATNIVDGDEVTFSGKYVIGATGQTDASSTPYNLEIVVSGADAFNYKLAEGTIYTGLINQREITIEVAQGFKLTYTGLEQQIQDVNLVAKTLVTNETLSGYVDFLGIGAGEYDFNEVNVLHSNGRIEITKADGVTDSSANYKITATGKLEIAKRDVKVSVGNVDLTYNGAAQTINAFVSLAVQNPANETLADTIDAEALNALTITYSPAEVVNVGSYNATISSASTNFNFTGTTTTTFSIKQKQISINLGENVVTFNPTSNHQTALQTSHAVGIVEGHSLVGTFRTKTSGNNVGTYTVTAGDVVIENVDIQINGKSVLSNYEIASQVGSIRIVAFKLESDAVALKSDSFVYNSKDRSKDVVVYFNDANGVRREISTNATTYGSFELVDATVAINVDKYSIKLNIPNYELPKDFVLEFNITKRKINNISFGKGNKVYDGTSSVKHNGKTEFTSQDFAGSDSFVIVGYYTINGVQTSNVGDNLDIVFEIKDANSLPQSNYEIARTGDKGSITKRTVSIKITPQAQVYNESGSYKIEYSEQAFDVVENIETYTLVEGHTLQGEVVVNKPDYDGNVDLATADYSKLFVMNSSEDVTANYNLVFEGQFVIEKAQISLDFAGIDTSYVYKNQPITITPNVTVSNGEEIEITQVYVDVRTNVEYTEALKDVGSYKTTFTVSNTHYEFKTASSFEYEITEYEFELQSSDIEVFKKAFGEPDPKLERQIETIYGEIVNVQFEREGGDNARAYDITIKSWDNKNYIIKLASGAGDDKFIITPAGTLKVVISATQSNKDKLQKTYDLEEIAPIDITTLEYKTYKVTEVETLVSEVVAGTISVEGINAGEYDISSFALTTNNYGAVVVEFETGLKYVINKRPITIQAQNGFIKVFDNTTTFDQTINIYDGANLLDAKYNLTITASYADSNVAKNIEMQLAFDGNIKENFEYQTVYGEITKRSVKVVPQSGLEVTYGTNLNGESDWGILYEIEDNTALNYEGDFKSQIIDGTLTISLKAGKTKYVAGEYEIVSTLTSNNLELNVQAGVIFTITKKQITISSESGFTKIYDGTSDVVLPADYAIEGLVEGDVVEVSGQFYKDGALSSSVGDKVIIWTLSGADADNYVASNSNGNISNKMVVVKFEYDTIANAAHNAKITDNEITEKQLVYGAEAGLLGDLPTPNHEGYTFAGWILDGQPFNNDTIIDENNWAIDVDEKIVQAQWTIKQFELKVVTLTRIDGIYKESEVGGTIDSSINKKYDYDSVVSLGGLATANYGYEFIGYADEITSSIIEGYITTGITVGLNGKDTTVYAFFKPLTPKITLDANGGQLSSSIDWQFVATGVSSLVVEYGKKLGDYSSFPIATKTGFGDYVWLDANGDEFDISAERVIDFAEDITLTASYEPLEYTITLYANGGEFTAFDTNVWTAVDKDGIPVAQGTKVEYVKKVVSYSLPIGEILTPTRAGWTFEGYDDAVLSNPETIWSELESKLITAKWSEKTYTIEIEAEHGQIIANVYDAQGIEISAIGNKNAVEIVGEKVVLTMLTTYQATIEVVQNQGYDFVNWTSDFVGIDQKTDKTVQINGLEAYSNEKALAVVANFTPAKNTIKIIVENHPTRGYAEVNGVSTETTQDGIIEVEAYTESTVEIKIVEFEGYSFAHINAVSNYNCVVEDGQDGKKVIKGFIDDVVVTITFEENLNDITIIADEDKGWFNVEDIIENSNSYTVAVKTEQPLVFDVYEKHGYLVDTNVDNWTFDTTSENKGTFALEQKDGFVRVTFTGFTFAGSITIPFVKDMFTVEVVAVKKDGSTLTVDDSLTEIVELSIASENLKLNSKSTFRYEYLTVVTLAPKQNIDGYTFLTWSSQADKVRQVLALEGNVATDDNGIMTFEVNGNISTIYVVYEIDNYTVKFKTSDEAKGQLKVGNIYHSEITSTIKYGYSSMEIVAVEKEGFAFKHWINEQTNEVVGTQKSFTATNVSESVTYVAVFEGVPVEIVFKVVLDKNDVFENGEIDFAELAFTETDVTKIQSVARQDNIITYHITTLTGEDVVFDYVEKQGYEFKGLISDPRYLLTQIGSTFKFSSIFYSSNVTVNVSAKVYDISIKLTGKTDGGLIYYDSSNTKGIEEYQVTENSLKFKVKYGGDVSSIIYALTGYTIVENPYIVKQSVSIEQASDINEFAIGGINSVSENLNIEVQIVPLKFQVTFKFNYDGEEQDVVSIIEFGETTFAPALPANVTRPTRLKYNFMGWNTMANAVGKAYHFDEYGNIYSYVYDSNGIKSMEYGFFGGVGDIKKVDNPDYDYTSILYADWELVTYRVNVYFVPGSAVDTTVGNYWNNLLPQPVGRWVEYSDDLQNRVVGIKYEPGSTVIVNAPTALKGYTYAGWAYEGNIKDVNLLSGRDGEQFVATMGEEELNVYLYYTIKVNVGVIGGGSATISATEAIYEQELTISAVANEGYSFKYWLDGSTQIPNSEATMTVIATKATTYIAVFEGFIVDVRVKNTDYASAKVSSTSGETNVYRVGDTITLSVYDVRIGYVHIGWGGENAGVTHNTYTITASDLNRRDAGGSYVEFIPNTDAVNVNVQFVIDANKDWLAGAFVFDGVENFETTTRTYKYDTILNINIATKQRFELTKLTLNGVEIDVNTKSMLINTQTGFAVTGVNEIKATFRQVLWVEVKAPFTGTGTEEDPYMILTPEHLAQMFYLVNNNIEAQGTIPYAEGYYRVKTNIVLAERFWQPIGTKENPFNGTFEIIDYGITELYLDQHYEVINFGGVFGYLGPNAKIIEGQGNYQSAIIIISSVSGVVVIVLAVFIVYIYYKRRKHQKMQKGINNKSADLIDEQSVDGEKKE